MANPRVYIRNSDRKKLPKKDYSPETGIILTWYRGTRATAKEKMIPLFYQNGRYVGNLGYPKGQPFYGTYGWRKLR